MGGNGYVDTIFASYPLFSGAYSLGGNLSKRQISSAKRRLPDSVWKETQPREAELCLRHLPTSLGPVSGITRKVLYEALHRSIH